MSHAVMCQHLSFIVQAGGWFFAGVVLGGLHFASLRWNARCLLGGHALLSLGLQLLRFGLTGGAMALVAKLFGAMPLMVGTLGLIAARNGVLLLGPQR